MKCRTIPDRYRNLLRDGSMPTYEEALAGIVGPDVASAVLQAYPTALSLTSATPPDLLSLRGVGASTCAQLMGAQHLARCIQHAEAQRGRSITSPADAAQLFFHLTYGLEQEHLFVQLLNTRNRPLWEPIEIYHGSLNTSLIRVGEIFRPAVKANAAAIIMAHNHPSGDPTPSPEDIAVSKAVKQAGELLDIELLDHLIISGNIFVSIKERTGF